MSELFSNWFTTTTICLYHCIVSISARGWETTTQLYNSPKADWRYVDVTYDFSLMRFEAWRPECEGRTFYIEWKYLRYRREGCDRHCQEEDDKTMIVNV